MKIKRIPAGIYAANCYVIYCEETKKSIVVDPGGDVDDILKVVKENELDVQYIILTHGHGDHIGGVEELRSKLKAVVLIHEGDLELLKDGSKNLSSMMATGTIEINPDKFVKDGDIIKFGKLEAKVIHTPGHTLGGICLLIGNYLISGDTLFQGSIGRTDLLGGDYETIINSIKNKLLILSEDTIVLPGHGGETSIKREKLSNPFLR